MAFKLTADPVEIGGQVLGIVTGLFTSKKHYFLYYWETADSTWKFVAEGHPSQLKPFIAQYKAQHIETVLIRNAKTNNAPPTTPPTGYFSTSPSSTNYLMIAVLVGMIGIAIYFLFIKRKRKK